MIPRFNIMSNIFLKYYKYFLFANTKGDNERKLKYKNSRIEAALNLSWANVFEMKIKNYYLK